MKRILYKPFTAAKIAACTGGVLYGENVFVNSVITDSRDGEKGALFVAIAGERFDGHDFAMSAIEKGADCLLVSHKLDLDVAQIVTADTVTALGSLAKTVRIELDPFVVAVTGSVGKTTTKQLIAAVLGQSFPTLFTEGNLNNEIGLPLTLLGLNEGHGAAVLEFGMSARGEISRLSRIAKPDLAVITNIGSSHLEYLKTRENIRDAKLEIRDGLKSDGVLILNGEEPLLDGIDGAIYVAFNREDADVRILTYCSEGEGMRFDLDMFGDWHIEGLYVPAIGRHVVYDAAIACAVGYMAGVDIDSIRHGLETFRNAGMRQNITSVNGVTLIRDCYNAAPESMRAAIDVLAEVSGKNCGRSIAVLGDMRELGESSDRLHLLVGEYTESAGVDMLVTFGESASHIAEGAVGAGFKGEIYRYPDLTDPKLPAEQLSSYVKSGDTVLFKASRAVEIERIADLTEKILEKNI